MFFTLIWHTNNTTQNTYHINTTIKVLNIQDYYTNCNLYIIVHLNKRFNIINCKFLYKLWHNIIDSPEILECTNFRINKYNSRNISMFHFSRIFSKYILYILVNMPMYTDNAIKDLDLFQITSFNLSIILSYKLLSIVYCTYFNILYLVLYFLVHIFI